MTNPIKLLTKVIVGIATMFVFASLAMQPVLAQTSPCPPRYTVIIQPYGITCLPPTPFAIGSVIINDATMLALVVAFIAVFAVVLNAVILKSKIKKI